MFSVVQCFVLLHYLHVELQLEIALVVDITQHMTRAVTVALVTKQPQLKEKCVTRWCS